LSLNRLEKIRRMCNFAARFNISFRHMKHSYYHNTPGNLHAPT
jgi:hypothetical protein